MQSVLSADPLHRRDALSDAMGDFIVAQATGSHVDTMVLECLEQLEATAPRATLGLIYLSNDLIDQFDGALATLRRAFPRVNWVGATVDTVMAECNEYRNQGALAIMLGEVAVDQFRILAGGRRSLSGRLASLYSWRQRNGISGALVHGDAGNPAVTELIDELSLYVGDVPLAGGLMGRSRPGLQVAVSVVSGGMSGILFGRDVDVFSGYSLGCSPLGRPHAITRMAGGHIFELDGRPALDVLFEESGELLSRDLQRLTSFIIPAFAGERGDAHYAPAEFLAIDRLKRSFSVDERIALSGDMRFYRRDGDAAWRHFDDLLTQAVERTRGRRICAGVFVGGSVTNSSAGTELASIRAALGHFPLIGYRADSDVFNGRRYSHSSVLTLLVN